MHFGIYKRELANRSRIVASVSLGILTVMGARWLKKIFGDVSLGIKLLGVDISLGHILAAVFAAGSIVGIFYLVNSKRCVDFLIETEAELAKVSWPTKKEFLGATAVVIFTMFFFGIYLFAVDILLQFFVKAIKLY